MQWAADHASGKILVTGARCLQGRRLVQPDERIELRLCRPGGGNGRLRQCHRAHPAFAQGLYGLGQAGRQPGKGRRRPLTDRFVGAFGLFRRSGLLQGSEQRQGVDIEIQFGRSPLEGCIGRRRQLGDVCGAAFGEGPTDSLGLAQDVGGCHWGLLHGVLAWP